MCSPNVKKFKAGPNPHTYLVAYNRWPFGKRTIDSKITKSPPLRDMRVATSTREV